MATTFNSSTTFLVGADNGLARKLSIRDESINRINRDVSSALLELNYKVTSSNARQRAISELEVQLSGVTSDHSLLEVGEFSNANYVIEVDMTYNRNNSLSLPQFTLYLKLIDVENGTELSVKSIDRDSPSGLRNTDIKRLVHNLLGIRPDTPRILRENSLGFGVTKRMSKVSESIGGSFSFKHAGQRYERVKGYFSMGASLTLNAGDLGEYRGLDDYFYLISSGDYLNTYQTDTTDKTDEYIVTNLTNMNFYIGGGIQYIILEAGVSLDITETNIQAVVNDDNNIHTDFGFIVKATTMIPTLRGHSVNFSGAYTMVNGYSSFMAGIEFDITYRNYKD